MGKPNKRRQYSTISLPTALVKEVEKVMDELEYWPTKTDFIREAVLEKLEKYKKEIEAKKGAEEKR